MKPTMGIYELCSVRGIRTVEIYDLEHPPLQSLRLTQAVERKVGLPCRRIEENKGSWHLSKKMPF